MASVSLIPELMHEIRTRGYCVLREHFPPTLVEACRNAFWPRLVSYLDSGSPPNRGPQRHFVPMPFDPPCFAPRFFFDPDLLGVVRGLLDDRAVADQWGCDIPLRGSGYQGTHIDFRRPLFPEVPGLVLPAWAMVVSFGLVRIGLESGPIEIAPGTHRLNGSDARKAVETGEIGLEAVPLEIGDVLVRHPWALHRGTPNRTDTPRALASIRYVRRWYADESREVESVPRPVWESLSADHQSVLRFPVGK